MKVAGRQSGCVLVAVAVAVAGARIAEAGQEICKNVDGLSDVMRTSTTDPAGQVMRRATTALRDSESCGAVAGSRDDVATLLLNIAQEVLEDPHEGEVAWICDEAAPVLARYAAENHLDGERAKRAAAAIHGFEDRLAREAVCRTKEGPKPPDEALVTTDVAAMNKARRQAGIVLLGVGSASLVAGFVLSGFVIDAEKDRQRKGIDERADDPQRWDRGWRLWGGQVSQYAVAGILIVTGAALILKARQPKKGREKLVNLRFRPAVSGVQIVF